MTLLNVPPTFPDYSEIKTLNHKDGIVSVYINGSVTDKTFNTMAVLEGSNVRTYIASGIYAALSGRHRSNYLDLKQNSSYRYRVNISEDIPISMKTWIHLELMQLYADEEDKVSFTR